MLTEKAKQSFIKWLNEQETAPYAVMFDETPLAIQLTYIIDWFDSVNINTHTDITPEYYIGKVYNTSLEFPDFEEKFYHNISRHEVQKQLIKVANEIYNNNEQRN